MDGFTEKLWTKQDRHPGDRYRLFSAVADAVDAKRVLYPGSFVDIAPSMVFDHVTYVDSDRRFPRFFDDEAGVRELIDAHRRSDDAYEVHALHADYEEDLPIEAESMDLLVSLYAGFVSEHCTRYLRRGGTLLVNPSHGDVAMASLDARYELSGVIVTRNGDYTFRSDNIDSYLVPKRNDPITVERLRELRRGIAYTKAPFAYLFTRTS